MGTSFARTTRAALVQELRTDLPEGYKLLASALKGSHLWLLLQPPTQPVKIGVYLLSTHKGEQGYKGLAEADGPNACDCPLSYLDLAPLPASPFAARWRERVRAHHARRASLQAPGQRIEFQGNTYNLVRKLAPRKGWEVSDSQGNVYRMAACYVARSKIV